MDHFLNIFTEQDIAWWYTTCRVGYNQPLLNQFICQLDMTIFQVEINISLHEYDDKQAYQLGKELLNILKTVKDIIVPPRDSIHSKTIIDRLDDAIHKSNAILK